MHERLQRRVCRVTFLCACVFPTFCVLVGSLYFHRPWQQQDWQQEFERELHLRASVERVSAPRPGTRVLDGLVVRQLRSDTKLAIVDSLRILPGKIIAAERLEIAATQLGEVVTAVETWLHTHRYSAPRANIEQLSIVHPDGTSFDLQDATILVTRSESGLPRFALAASRDGRSLRLLLEQHASGSWSFALDCTKLAVPTWLLVDGVPAADRCHQSTFSGILQIVTDAAQLSGKLEGTLSELDLQRFLGNGSPHRCQGTANLTLKQYRWRGESLVAAEGTLRAGEGQISRSLLQAMAKWLNFRLPSGVKDGEPSERIDVSQWVCNFRIDGRGAEFHGVADQSESDCVLLGTVGPLLLAPMDIQPSLFCLAHVFYPHEPESAWLPANRDAIELSRRLPAFGEDATTSR